MTTFVYKLELGGLHLEPTVSASTFVGHPTDIWADAANPNILRRGDGVTPGGHVIGPVGTGFSGSYNDLTNLPTIPSDIAQLTDVNNLLGTGGSGFDGSFASLTGIPTTIAGYGITDAFDGDYNNLTNVPVIPTVPTTVSSFSNDSGYITSADLNNLSIDLLQDVDTTVAPTNGQALVWNSTTNVWEPGTVATSNAPENLDDLNDVTYGVVTLDGSNGGGLFLGWSQVDNAWRPLDVTIDWNLVTNKPTLLTSETVTTLSLAANTLSYVDENGAQTDLDLSLYLDDTNAARITQGVYDNNTGLATFTRDDTTTFTVDFNSLLAGAGISLSDISGTGDIAFNQTTGEISFNNNSGYLTSYTETDTLQSVTSRGAVTTTTSVIPFYYADQTAFPNASTYHGAIAHSHSDGAMYFAHGGVWNKLANDSQLSGYSTFGGDYNSLTNTPTIPTDVSDLTDTTNLLDHFAVTIQDTAPTGSAGDLWWESDVGTLKIYYDGTWVDASPSSGGGSGIALTDLSITTASAGTASLAYDNTTGVFTYTPPDLSGYQTTASAFDGDYNSLTNQPTIPSDVSDLTDTTNLLSSGGSGIALTDLSVTTAANGLAGLSYDNTSGVFTFTPPDLSGYLESGGTINVSSIEPTATTSGDGDNLTITGGDATDLNSQGGDTIITGGSGALISGSVDIGTTQTDAITIGATGIGTTIGDTLTVNGNATFESGTFEAFSTITGATGTVTHDCDNGHIFYHTSPSSNFTANFTNLGLSTNYATGITIVIDQGATARIPSAVQTDGTGRTIVWQGGSAPSGTNNGVDVVSFSILRTSGSYVVLGQLVDFA